MKKVSLHIGIALALEDGCSLLLIVCEDREKVNFLAGVSIFDFEAPRYALYSCLDVIPVGRTVF
jgi:hypothetical protein